MARPKARALDGGKPHRLLLGTPNGLVAWEYATASDARDRIKTYLSEIENFGTRYNKALADDVKLTRREILNADFPEAKTFGIEGVIPEKAKQWTFTDAPTNLTWVVALWKEK